MSTTKAMAHSTPAHGLTYPQSFFDSLPVADDIPLLTAPLFSSLHYQHILSHPPDSVLFPFVHGIEGDNEAQNGFFANSYPTNATADGPRIPLPSYRGMMWVVCEDDLENPEKELRVLVHPRSLSPSPSPSPSPDEWDDDESDESISEDEDHGASSGTSSYGDPVSPVTPHVPASTNPLLGVAEHGMHLDGVVHVLDDYPSVDESKDIQQHMHPVQHRSTLPSIQTDFGPGHERSTSGISGITTSTESESWGDHSAMDSEDNRPVPQTIDSVPQTQCKPSQRHHKASLPPPILTSTFRASELLRRVPGSRSSSKVSTKTKALRDGMRIGASYAKGMGMDIEDDNTGRRNSSNTEGGNDRSSDDDEENSDGEWEFIPLYVPDGISLRNFGIQVPILASISDIIIYSPTSSGAAHSKHAKRLAKRFRMAQERLWRGRWEGLGISNEKESESKGEGGERITSGEEGGEGITGDEEGYEDFTSGPRVKYNTFILDATADDISKVMPHLVVRLWKEGEVPGSLSPSGQTMMLGGGLNVASGLSSAPVLREGEGAADVDQDGDIVMSESPVPWSAPSSNADILESGSKEGWSQLGPGPGLGPNTVDFAQREKDEMRDLTRASEIISVFPLGSSGLAVRDGDGNIRRGDVDGEYFEEDGDLDLDVGDVGEEQHQQVALDPDLSTTLTYFNPHIGQVFLGNASDVPLPVAPRLPPPPLLPSGPGQLPHPSSVPPYPYPPTTYRTHMEGNRQGFVDEEQMRMEKAASDFWVSRSEGRRARAQAKVYAKSMKVESDSNNSYPDSVFPYPSPPPNPHTNSSSYPQNLASSPNPTLTLNTPHSPPPNTPSGYDICIECHDLAPFPTYAHIKASEEKVWELEERWRGIVELERIREEGGRETQASLNGSEAEAHLEHDGDHNMGDREAQATSDGSTKNFHKKIHYTLPPRPTPHPNSIIHLPMPSSPPASAATMGALMPVVRFLEKCLFSQGSGGRVSVEVEVRSAQLSQERDDREAMKIDERKETDSGGGTGTNNANNNNNKSRRWSSVLPSFSGFPSHPAAAAAATSGPIEMGNGAGTSRHRSMTFASQPSTTSTSASTSTLNAGLSDSQPHSRSAQPYTSITYTFVSHSSRLSSSSSRSSHPSPNPSFHSYPTATASSASTPYTWSRPLKILLYSADGYTESSVPALCLLMALKGLSLPGAYLELQVKKKRSFFVYHGDLGILRRVEAVLEGERREREREERVLRERREREERERRVKEDRERERDRGRAMKEKEGRPGKETDGGGWFGLGGLGGIGTHINPYRAWGNNNPSSASATASQHRVQPPRADLSSLTEHSPARQQVAHILQQVQQQQQQQSQGKMRPAAKSVSFAQSPYAHAAHPTSANTGSSSLPTSSSTPFLSGSHPSSGLAGGSSVNEVVNPTLSPSKAVRRPRASTSPWLPSSTSFGLFGGDHQSWFNDARFDGSFPSRVLPFLYLGNLAHASNVYMLQALGITHVVSVGECALVPPDHFNSRTHPYVHYPHSHSNSNSHSQHARHGSSPNPNSHSQHDRAVPGSLWIEERAGRIKVLDIQGICDDGIDTLEPQLEPICEWIEEARKEGGQVLVHCRVGVSRSATVVIAYVMKHLSLPLVDAYLIVRSRRLSVLIQPNMRLLYNLLGWEIKLAKERVGWIVKQKGKEETEKDHMGPSIGVGVGAGEDEYDEKLKRELASALSWPYLAKEVHKLNEKYLR